jgi:isoleucyl-tRNA synthetase
MNLKETLNLPQADFTIPMKAGLPQLEPQIQARWEEQGIYHEIQRARQGAPTFVLHDGPPYTNGPIHLGTALNKTLKDFVVKSQTLMGKQAPYVPGYDSHGLPIELAVQKKLSDKKITPTVPELREACREHARHYIGVQTTQFRRLGVFGEWEKPYSPMNANYQAEVIRIFRRLVEAGTVYRGLRPVMWSPTSRTALADTEIVYKDHVSTAIHVAFPVKSDPDGLFNGLENVFTVIWTTTPWTIPANQACAFHPEFTYELAEHGGSHYLLVRELREKVMAALDMAEHTVVRSFTGADLENVIFAHPVFGRDSRAVLADYVTTEDGTGVVHTAPGHGREDFQTGLKYGMVSAERAAELCPVDDRGVLTAEAGEFEGVYYQKCDTVVVDRLRELGRLLKAEPYHHTYPHAERDGMPVIFRATEQWFISIDHDGMRGRMLEALEGVKFHPESGGKRIKSMIGGRPDWCISRQRPWGIGIPIFYGAQSGEPCLDPEAIEFAAQAIEKHGPDAWFTLEPGELLPEGYAHPQTGETEFRKETDVFDVWFDSSCTNLCVLEGRVEPEWGQHWPADLFLEGSDQHRGWFNVSLITAFGAKGAAPYRQVLTHGFVTDGDGQKQSKRLGNVIDPLNVCEKFGADILRYWVASVNYEDDVPCTDELLAEAGDGYRRIRNTLRFLLANVADYDPESAPSLHPLDSWMMDQVDLMTAEVLESYRTFKFHLGMRRIHDFCANEVSAVYLDAIKDRMYCDGADWESRRSAQRACRHALLTLTRLCAPILVHTAEEVYGRIPGAKLASVHLEIQAAPGNLDAKRARAAELTQLIHEVRHRVFNELDQWRKAEGVRDTQDVEIEFSLTAAEEPMRAVMQSLGDQLPILFKCADVRLGAPGEPTKFARTAYEKCERSWLRRADVAEDLFDGQTVRLTARDRRALGLA